MSHRHVNKVLMSHLCGGGNGAKRELVCGAGGIVGVMVDGGLWIQISKLDYLITILPGC